MFQNKYECIKNRKKTFPIAQKFDFGTIVVLTKTSICLKAKNRKQKTQIFFIHREKVTSNRDAGCFFCIH